MRTNQLLPLHPINKKIQSSFKTPEKNHLIYNGSQKNINKIYKKQQFYSQNSSENSTCQNSNILTLPSKILYSHDFKGIKINRGVLLEWLLDICGSLILSWQVYWCAVQILDFLILEFGGCCLFMALKARHRYSWKKLTIEDLLQKVLHNNFSKNQFIETEAQILILIGQKGHKSKHFTTVYDQNLQIIGKISQKIQTEIFRKLVLLWINPQKCLEGNHVTYTQAYQYMKVCTMRENDIPQLTEIEEFFANNYNCKNLMKKNRKIRKIPL